MTKLGLFAFGFSFLLRAAAAQVGGCFTVINPQTGNEGEYSGCFPFNVNVQKCPSVTTNVKYCFNLPDSLAGDWLTNAQFNALINEFVDNTSFEYNSAGTYYIAQFANVSNGDTVFIKTRKITVYNPGSKPEFSWNICGKILELQFTDTVFSQYEFNPGNGGAQRIINQKKETITYPSAANSPFIFTIKGLLPSTCNKDLLDENISLYETPKAPVPDSLVAIGNDTSAFKARIQIRADEDYAFQLAEPSGTYAGFFSPGREDNANTGKVLIFPPLAATRLQGSRIRAITRKRCSNVPDEIFPAPEWTVFWPICESENQKITIKWNVLAINGLQKFQIFRDGVLLSEPTLSSGQFLDENNLVCGVAYRYHFLTEVSRPGGGTMVFISAGVDAKAVSNRPPDPVQFPTASVIGTSIEVSGKASPLARTYHLYRREREGSVYAEIGNGFAALPITDNTALPKVKAYCYRIAFDDICGNKSLLSDSICPVFLKASQQDGSIELNWTSLDGWLGGPGRYELIRKISGKPNKTLYFGLDKDFVQLGQDQDAKRLVYVVKTLASQTASYPLPSFSNEVEIIQESRFRFPDAFTPNQDGVNDDFRCYGSFLKSFQLIIYNSWGNIVFSTDNPNAVWDGKIDGVVAQTGNYAFRAIATDEVGERLEKSGFFALIR